MTTASSSARATESGVFMLFGYRAWLAARLQTVRRWAETQLDWLADDSAKLRTSLEHMSARKAAFER